MQYNEDDIRDLFEGFADVEEREKFEEQLEEIQKELETEVDPKKIRAIANRLMTITKMVGKRRSEMMYKSRDISRKYE